MTKKIKQPQAVKVWVLVDKQENFIHPGWVYAYKHTLIEDLKTAGMWPSQRKSLVIKRAKVSIITPKRRAKK